MEAPAVVPEQEHATLVAALVTRDHHLWTAGQKVYIYQGYWGEAERVEVIGHHRRKHRWISAAIPIKSLTNFRIKKVFDPGALRAIERQYYAIKAREFTESTAQYNLERLRTIEAHNQAEAMIQALSVLFRIPYARGFYPEWETAEQYATRHPDLPFAHNWRYWQAWLAQRQPS